MIPGAMGERLRTGNVWLSGFPAVLCWLLFLKKKKKKSSNILFLELFSLCFAFLHVYVYTSSEAIPILKAKKAR